MFPKTILAVVASDQNLETLEKAIALSKAHDCHLAVAVIGVALPPPAAVYNVVPADTWSEEREAGRVETAETADKVRDMIAAAAVSGDVMPSFCDVGQIAGVVATRANYTDLALVLSDIEMDARVRTKALSGLIFESAKPFLVMPASSAPSLEPEKVLVAWNGSREAAHATHLALDMLSRARNVHVAMVDPIAGEHSQGEEPGNDIASYLARHGVSVSVDILSGSGQEPAQILQRHATDIAADLIVAGCYGHSRLREYIFGGTTRDMLESVKVPLFMAH